MPRKLWCAPYCSEVPLLAAFPWKCASRWGTEHCETRKKTKFPNTNEGKAAWPLGYLCSGRAAALARFIFLFRKNRDLKYQIHLEGIRVLHGEKAPICCIICIIMLWKLGSLQKNNRCFCRTYWERDGELHWRADSENIQEKFTTEWKISTEIRSYFLYTVQRSVCWSQ